MLAMQLMATRLAHWRIGAAAAARAVRQPPWPVEGRENRAEKTRDAAQHGWASVCSKGCVRLFIWKAQPGAGGASSRRQGASRE